MLDENRVVDVPVFKAIKCLLPVPPKWKNKMVSTVGDLGAGWMNGFNIGTIFNIPIGTPVYSPWGGVCIYSKNSREIEGLTIKISSVDDLYGNFQHTYTHMDRAYIDVGDRVCPEDIIGLSGNSGMFNKDLDGGFHLHFEISRDKGQSKEYFKPEFV